MLNRRTILTAAAIAFTASSAWAQDWKAKYPELTFAVVPAENASGVSDRYAPFIAYLSKELGTKVALRIANDYAAVIEGRRSGNVHVAMYGPAAYARASLTGVKIEPFAIEIGGDGSRGYYSVLYVKTGSNYKTVQDLKGKNICLVDPNSTSGNNVPRFALNKMGIEPETFFSKVVYSGSHENAIIGLGQGTCDAAFNWWNDENESNLLRMERKNMAKSSDYRVIFKSDQIVNSPMAYLADLPADLKAKIKEAVLELANKDKAAFDKIYEGKQLPFQPVDHKEYGSVIELVKFVDTLRKAKS